MEVKIITIKLATPTNPSAIIEYGVWNGTSWAIHGEQVSGDVSSLSTLAEAQAAAVADATAKGLI